MSSRDEGLDSGEAPDLFECDPSESTTARPDTARIRNGLKDFQRETVDYVFSRLYGAEDPTDRFLVADEVGLGKTMVARGLIARVIDHLWDSTDRIDIVYICSNADIARQNINRLNVTGQRDFAHASRITLLPFTLNGLKQNRMNFISFTPGTSFDLKSSLGIAWERALLYRLLRQAWDFTGDGPLHVFRGASALQNFVWYVHDAEKQKMDASLADAFMIEIRKDPALKASFNTLNAHAVAQNGQFHGQKSWDRSWLIGELRGRLAVACLSALQPNLIILDEFQRFKNLLDGDDQASLLARYLFQCPGGRVLMLSATPYKMYTRPGETEEGTEEDHYTDFLRTFEFLNQDEGVTANFKQLLNEYRRVLLQLGQAPEAARSTLMELKDAIEAQLRRVMVRTERLAVSDNRNGMLRVVPAGGAQLHASDLRAYLALRKITDALGYNDPLEFWKSAPYLLNFMDDYKLKQAFAAEIASAQPLVLETDIPGSDHHRSDGFLLSWEDISAYQAIDPGNSRLRALGTDTVEAGLWQLLWIPPCLRYYHLDRPFDTPAAQRFTKRLVFSAWQVVPKVIAALMSYDAERRIVRSFEENPDPFEQRIKRRPLLRFARTEGRLTGMALLGMLYPCVTLARECDPLTFSTASETGSMEAPSLARLLAALEKHVAGLLAGLPITSNESGSEDERWYWAAPILLDLQYDPKETHAWLYQPHLPSHWIGEVEPDSAVQEETTHWAEHVAQALEAARDYHRGQFVLGRPPADLARVLAYMAVGGPGVVAWRALARITGGLSTANSARRTGAAQIAWAFRRLYNLPESMALIRGLYGSSMEAQRSEPMLPPAPPRPRDTPYWKQTLEYAAAGGLQMVMDEYTHLLVESRGLFGAMPNKICTEVSQEICATLTLRTSTVQIDAIHPAPESTGSSPTLQMEKRRMRGHFALRFGEERTDDGTGVLRAEQVRTAFNSPFWPFVLATTSVGQEGLDFHPYCHAVVHWNLPSNPVDLEQREGRVHRYKGHAVRKNIALAYGEWIALLDSPDPWEQLFDLAKSDRESRLSDIVPYWVFQHEGGAQIERHVPLLPLSRDSERLDWLLRALTLYRLVFGQSRQEDLLHSLDSQLSRLPAGDAKRFLEEIQINLEPPKAF